MLLCNASGYEEITTEVLSSGGRWYLCYDVENDLLLVAVWTIQNRTHASIDYLSIHNSMHGVGLGLEAVVRVADDLWYNNGVRYFHGLVYDEFGDFISAPTNALVPRSFQNVQNFYMQLRTRSQ